MPKDDVGETIVTKSKMFRFVLMAAASALLAGCTNMNLFKDNPEPAPAPAQPEMQPSLAPAGGLTSPQITQALSGKSWRWSGPNNSGVTLYANDGSSLVEVTGKGTTTGKWQAKDGQLCESFSPAPFLPKGVPMTCQPMTRLSNSSYKVGQATFTLD